MLPTPSPSSTIDKNSSPTAPALVPSPPAPIHNYREPQLPMPRFTQGQDRFPYRVRRFHAPSEYNPNRHEVLPGMFTNFDKVWNGRALRINDEYIRAIKPETMFTGIHYRIDLHPGSWGNRKLRRGDLIILRGFAEDNIRYIVTWERAHEMEEGTSYVQVNAIRNDKDAVEYAVESSDKDWPTFGLFVPISNCYVDPAPAPAFSILPTFTNPFVIANGAIPSTYDDHLNLSRIQRRNALHPDSDMQPVRWLKRTWSTIGKCGE